MNFKDLVLFCQVQKSLLKSLTFRCLVLDNHHHTIAQDLHHPFCGEEVLKPLASHFCVSRYVKNLIQRGDRVCRESRQCVLEPDGGAIKNVSHACYVMGELYIVSLVTVNRVSTYMILQTSRVVRPICRSNKILLPRLRDVLEVCQHSRII